MRIFLPLLLLLINGCQSTSFDSNAGEYVKHQIRESVVESFTNEEVWRLRGAQVGYVETNYCQVDYRDLTPSTNAFISELKVKTQKLGGNALVFDSCIKGGNVSCHKLIQCRGMAYKITYNQ